jgi:acylphosphatase
VSERGDAAPEAGQDGAKAPDRERHAAIRAVHLVVSGRVQGVFYRASTREVGETLGLAGWVRNRYDGTVEAHVQGDPATVAAMVDWCRQGPPHARVDDLQVDDVPADPGLTEFRIRP